MVRLICADISSLSPSDHERLCRAASPARRMRAERYLRKEDSLRCVASEALLRYALGTAEFTVVTDPSGKPRIAEHPHFHFNLSHSGDWVVIACGDKPVGVDVQEHRPDTDIHLIARQFFSPREQMLLSRAADPRRTFHEIWTGKESYLKYLGTGLKHDLQSFSIDHLTEKGLTICTPRLADGYSLSLCTTENAYSLELLDGQRLR